MLSTQHWNQSDQRQNPAPCFYYYTCFLTPHPSSTGKGFLQTEVTTPFLASYNACRSLSQLLHLMWRKTCAKPVNTAGRPNRWALCSYSKDFGWEKPLIPQLYLVKIDQRTQKAILRNQECNHTSDVLFWDHELCSTHFMLPFGNIRICSPFSNSSTPS